MINLDNELKGLLESVVRDALEPLRTEIKAVRQDLQDVKFQINNRFDTLETKISFMQEEISELNLNNKLNVVKEQMVSEQLQIKDLERNLKERQSDIKLIK